MPTPRQDIFYLHLLRCIAAIAVIAIHVLGPFRFLYGEIPFDAWFSAVGINALSRWAVPIFMMISGALLLSSNKPFDARHYLKRRLGKVVIPFVAWSLIYAGISGALANDPQITVQAIVDAPANPTWYHLWFFYDFIPLYFVIPLLAPLLKAMNEEQIKILLAGWLTLTCMHFLKVPSFLREPLVLFIGYLVLGWYLFNRDNRSQLPLWLGLGISAAVINLLGSYWASDHKGAYSALFMGYKSINTVVIGAMLFVLAQSYAERLGAALRRIVTSISTYSLGIYLIHPLLLIPIRSAIERDYAQFGHPAVAIPALTLLTLVVAWALTALLARLPIVRQLVP
ncbi:acyltransferase [Ferrimonas pelagia]|uniref:Acyltransferase n=2 Tax=Ferrimonas pelagia TaxID=1177826 RepID=A0ABP9ENA7_9GAMM